jgi:hypothetical protein
LIKIIFFKNSIGFGFGKLKAKDHSQKYIFYGLAGLESLWTTLEKVELSLVYFEVQK